jgi:inner membrane protein
MLWRTHILAGASVGLLIAGHNADIETAAISAGIAGVAALLPDLDSPHSKIGRLVPTLPKVLTLTVGHRGLLHSIVGAVTVSLLLAAGERIVLGNLFSNLYLLVLAGYVSHILIDTFTNSGCPLLWPWPAHIRIPLFHTGSIIEKLFLFPVMCMFLVWLAWPIVHNFVSHVLHIISAYNMS